MWKASKARLYVLAVGALTHLCIERPRLGCFGPFAERLSYPFLSRVLRLTLRHAADEGSLAALDVILKGLSITLQMQEDMVRIVGDLLEEVRCSHTLL